MLVAPSRNSGEDGGSGGSEGRILCERQELRVSRWFELVGGPATLIGFFHQKYSSAVVRVNLNAV